jgi:hypothetical protein
MKSINLNDRINKENDNKRIETTIAYLEPVLRVPKVRKHCKTKKAKKLKLVSLFLNKLNKVNIPQTI